VTTQAHAVSAAAPVEPPSTAPGALPGTRRLRIHPALLIAVLAAVLRVPYLRAPMSPDEGGFLVVARHWHPGGGSLYGPYWVDRPPLLISFFRLADALGGFTALRLLGCVVVALTVIGVAVAAASTASTAQESRRASTWAAAVAAALLVTPTGGAVMVNGELIAGPFIAFGVACAIRAVLGDTRPTYGLRLRPDVAAVVAGVCGAAALMVKQNMLDVLVFGVALGLAAAVRHRASVAVLARRGLLALAGVVGGLVVILGGAMARGTTPWGVFFAMYPFRVRATEAMQHLPTAGRTAHLTKMLEMWGVTGAPLVICGFVALVLLRRTPTGPLAGPLVFATLVLTAYGAASIIAGGSYWSHYVLQLVVPTALMAGLMLASVPWAGRAAASCVLGLCALGWYAGTTARVPAAGSTIGAAIKDASLPDDTMLSLLGDGAMVETSGLTAPYTYLWSLPAHVLDVHFRHLTSVLQGPDAPSWVVVRNTPSTHLMQRQGPGAVLHHRYRKVATMCGRTVFLRADLSRVVPQADQRCSQPLVAWNDDAAIHNWTVTEGSPAWSQPHHAH
jgi:hypothetical protein